MESIVSQNFTQHTPRDVKSYESFVEEKTFTPVTEKIVFNLSVGASDFIDGSRSFVSFGLFNNRDTSPDFSYGFGSALNWIKSIQLYSSDGQIIDDIQNVNIYKASINRWTKPTSYFTSGKGESIGYNSATARNGTFTITLDELIPLFGVKTYLPSNLVNGMRIMIELAPVYELLYTNTVPVADLEDIKYFIEEPRIHLCVNKMDHDFIKSYTGSQQIIEFDTYKNQEKYFNKERINVSLQYSMAKAKYVVSVLTEASDATDPEVNAGLLMRIDFAKSNSFGFSEFQYRVGNITVPNRPAKSLEGYEMASSLFPDMEDVSFVDFNSNQGILVCDLTRGNHGTPINNNNEVTLEFKNALAFINPKTVNMFCVYTKRLVLEPVSEEERQAGYVNKLSIME